MMSPMKTIENNLLVYCSHLVYNSHNRRIDGKYVGGNKFRPIEEWEIHRKVHKAAITEEQANVIESQIKKRKTAGPKPRKYLLPSIL
jgi:hypothetical protein